MILRKEKKNCQNKLFILFIVCNIFEFLVPICMPPDGSDFTGRMATVTGWGRLKYGGGVPSVLQEVQVIFFFGFYCIFLVNLLKCCPFHKLFF